MRHNTESVIASPGIPPSPTPQFPEWDVERAPLLGHAPSGYSPYPTYHTRGSFTPPVVASGSRMAFHDHSFVPGLCHPGIQYPRLQPYDIGNGGPLVAYVPVPSTSRPFDSFHREGGDSINVEKFS